MWVQLPIYDGRYSIDENGMIYNSVTGNYLRACVFNNGYLYNTLYIDDHVQKKFANHRLVAQSFLPNPNNYPIVLHLDNNPLNNHINNLKWGTYTENIQQAIRDGNLTKHSKDYVLYHPNGPCEITINGIENMLDVIQLPIKAKSIHNTLIEEL